MAGIITKILLSVSWRRAASEQNRTMLKLLKVAFSTAITTRVCSKFKLYHNQMEKINILSLYKILAVELFGFLFKIRNIKIQMSKLLLTRHMNRCHAVVNRMVTNF